VYQIEGRPAGQEQRRGAGSRDVEERRRKRMKEKRKGEGKIRKGK
jgi:hypothetical protein